MKCAGKNLGKARGESVESFAAAQEPFRLDARASIAGLDSACYNGARHSRFVDSVMRAGCVPRSGTHQFLTLSE